MAEKNFDQGNQQGKTRFDAHGDCSGVQNAKQKGTRRFPLGLIGISIRAAILIVPMVTVTLWPGLGLFAKSQRVTSSTISRPENAVTNLCNAKALHKFSQALSYTIPLPLSPALKPQDLQNLVEDAETQAGGRLKNCTIISTTPDISGSPSGKKASVFVDDNIYFQNSHQYLEGSCEVQQDKDNWFIIDSCFPPLPICPPPPPVGFGPGPICTPLRAFHNWEPPSHR